MSTSSRDNRLLSSMSKTRRTPPGDVQGSVFFTGQGGRTVLPPLSSAFPTSRFPVPNTYNTPYTQPRSSPRYDLNPQALNNIGQWPSGNTSSHMPTNYSNYDTTERYYTTTAYPSRTSSPGASPDSPGEPRRLPPISGATSLDRWSQTAYVATPSNYQSMRGSTAAYASVYPYATSNPATSYPYSISPQDHSHHPQPQLTASPSPTMYGEVEPHRSERSIHQSSVHQANLPPAPTASGAANEEPAIKKKRKRADANQLKVLNDTYNRTAFPSTEERLHLAKILDMSPRSVQIWFQNKRQSMRQTSRQSSSTNSTTHQSFAVVSPGDALIEEMGHPSSAYGSGSVPMTDVPYLTAAPQDSSRAHNPHSSSSHQRIRGTEDVDSRKWSRGY